MVSLGPNELMGFCDGVHGDIIKPTQVKSYLFIFQGLFRNFDDSFMQLLRPHIERLVSDTRHDTHETSQRCAAEMISGIIRGSKHWTFEKVTN